MSETYTDPETYAVIGAAMEVHKVLGCGFLEAVYQQAMTIELEAKKIPFRTEVQFPVSYKDRGLDCYYKADLICYENGIVELKALEALTGKHDAQLINYLKATGCKRGLLLNFGQSSLQYQQRIL
jgi:GxxExxY protein